jgi:hypothetical protein
VANFDFSNHPQTMVPWASLKPNPTNPQKRPPKQVEQLVQALRRFDFQGPLIVDDGGVIHARKTLWEAAGKSGFDDLPVSAATGSTPLSIDGRTFEDVTVPRKIEDADNG